MTNPTVCAICLVNGRPEMVQRAIRCFREQTYPAKQILIYDSGELPVCIEVPPESLDEYLTPSDVLPGVDSHKRSIGVLRNEANWLAKADILVHFDSDDWSHPRRIEEQVALLQASGKQCVGYRDMLFWRECSMCHGGRDNTLPNCPGCGLKYDPNRPTPVGEAWLYSNNDPRYCLGTSLCYWRSAWEARPFPDAPKPGGSGEDKVWLDGIDSIGVCSSARALLSAVYCDACGVMPIERLGDGKRTMPCPHCGRNCPIATNVEVWPSHGEQTALLVAANLPERFRECFSFSAKSDEPRMIASIHGGNTSTQYADLGRVESNNWRRAPEWNAHCRERMKL